jgi:tellurite resistance protein
MSSYEHRTWWHDHDLTARLTNPSFLEAVVVGAFVVGAADGAVSAEEYDALLDRLIILGDVDRDAVDELLGGAAQAMEADGAAPLLRRVGELLVDDAAREAALMVALAVALADDEVAASEREVATQLATAVGLARFDLDAAFAILRG